jgi:uncharacterized protein YjbJ (UPF0337 family)
MSLPVRPPRWNNQPEPCRREYRQEDPHHAEAVKGGAKKTAGRVTGSQGLRTQGRTGQAKGNIKQAGAQIKDAFRYGLSGDSTRDGGRR